jgi:hypothetical protein
MLRRSISIAILSLIPLLSQQAQAFQNEGWWVVVGTYPADSSSMTAEATDAEMHGRSCGLKIWNEWSAKFTGFRPGYHVIVLKGEPFSARERAQAAVARARGCYPDAYVKYGRYLGE